MVVLTKGYRYVAEALPAQNRLISLGRITNCSACKAYQYLPKTKLPMDDKLREEMHRTTRFDLSGRHITVATSPFGVFLQSCVEQVAVRFEEQGVFKLFVDSKGEFKFERLSHHAHYRKKSPHLPDIRSKL